MDTIAPNRMKWNFDRDQSWKDVRLSTLLVYTRI